MSKLSRRRQQILLIVCFCILLLGPLGLWAVTRLGKKPIIVCIELMHYTSLEETTEDAAVVVRGRVVRTKGPASIQIGPHFRDKMKYRVSEVEILEVASGDNLAVGDIINVKQETEDKNAYHLSKGEEAILFLADFRARTNIAPFVPLNRTQGIISSGNVEGKANKTSVADVKNSLGVAELSYEEIRKQVVAIADEKASGETGTGAVEDGVV